MAVLGQREPVAARGSGTAEPGVVAYRAVLPGVAEAVRVARRFVRAVAVGCGRADDAELLVSELASGALRRAAADTGTFAVAAVRGPGWLRLAAVTNGSGWWPGGDGVDEAAYACGLAIVAGLADSFGHFGTSGGAAVLWAEVTLSGDGGGRW